MIGHITDEDVRLLASVAAALKPDYAPLGQDPWQGSPFAWIRTCPSRQRGKIGEQLVAGWCAAKGIDVVRSPDAQADRIINGQRVEIKSSTLWASGIYKFQQIREQDYEYLFCLGISPFGAHAWVIPKTLLQRYVIGHMGQHTGRGGTETAWLSVNPTNPLAWLMACGGTLRQAYEVLRNI